MFHPAPVALSAAVLATFAAFAGRFNVWSFCSNPNDLSDDCAEGSDHDTIEEAELDLELTIHGEEFPFVVMFGPGIEAQCWRVHSLAQVRKDAARSARKLAQENASWRNEIAAQAGMGGGCDAYNDAMGW